MLIGISDEMNCMTKILSEKNPVLEALCGFYVEKTNNQAIDILINYNSSLH